MKIGDEVYIHGYVDEIRKDTIIIKNEGGYFGTIPSEIIDSLKTDDYENEIEKLQQWLDIAEYDKERLREEITRLEPKTGHWVRDTITDLYHCSCCRYICHQDPKNKDNYCPYCGARMSEVSE